MALQIVRKQQSNAISSQKSDQLLCNRCLKLNQTAPQLLCDKSVAKSELSKISKLEGSSGTNSLDMHCYECGSRLNSIQHSNITNRKTINEDSSQSKSQNKDRSDCNSLSA